MFSYNCIVCPENCAGGFSQVSVVFIWENILSEHLVTTKKQSVKNHTKKRKKNRPLDNDKPLYYNIKQLQLRKDCIHNDSYAV